MLGLGLGLGLALALKLGLDLATKVILTTTSSTFTISNVHTPFDASEVAAMCSIGVICVVIQLWSRYLYLLELTLFLHSYDVTILLCM